MSVRGREPCSWLQKHRQSDFSLTGPLICAAEASIIRELSLCWAWNLLDQSWQYQGIEFYQTVGWLLRSRQIIESHLYLHRSTSRIITFLMSIKSTQSSTISLSYDVHETGGLNSESLVSPENSSPFHKWSLWWAWNPIDRPLKYLGIEYYQSFKWLSRIKEDQLSSHWNCISTSHVITCLSIKSNLLASL